jgi:hypothetical protein
MLTSGMTIILRKLRDPVCVDTLDAQGRLLINAHQGPAEVPPHSKERSPTQRWPVDRIVCGHTFTESAPTLMPVRMSQLV